MLCLLGAIATLKEAGVTVSPNEAAATIKSQLLARCKQATSDQNKVDELRQGMQFYVLVVAHASITCMSHGLALCHNTIASLVL